MQNEANWAILDSLNSIRNLGRNFSSELRLRQFKMLRKAKKTLYNFYVLHFERFGTEQGQDWA